jgi:hypothetical protein
MATMIFNLCCGLVAPVRLRTFMASIPIARDTLEHRAISRPLLPGKLASILDWSSLPGPATLVADECRSQLAIHPSKYEHVRGVVSRVSKASTMGDPRRSVIPPSPPHSLVLPPFQVHRPPCGARPLFEPFACLQAEPIPQAPRSREKMACEAAKGDTYLLRPLIGSIILDDS